MLTGGGRLPLGRMRQLKLASQLITAAMLALLAVYLFVLMPLPYYIMLPGTAEDIHPMVHTGQSGYEEKGKFMLTTVSVVDGNLSSFIWAKLRHQEIERKENVQQQGETEKEYEERQQYVMLTSQSSAMQAAYTKLGIPFQIASHGVMVLRTVKDMPAAGILKAGDVIVSVDGTAVGSHDELVARLQNKKQGDAVDIGYKRGDAAMNARIPLALFPGETKYGLGIETGDMLAVEPKDAANKVTVDAGDIGGPSAGLMFSLEIYNQLTPEDITKGYRIAGTGEITPDGKVGVIGGITYKVAAAAKEGADIFFAPQDLVMQDGTAVRNTTDAQEEASKLHTRMKIVSVATMDDALAYLASLPPKS